MRPTHATAPTPTPVEAAVHEALARVAPAWPLDRFIAVNPLWGYVDLPFDEAASQVAALEGARLTMPRAWYRDAFLAGRFTQADVTRALDELGSRLSVDEVVAALHTQRVAPVRRERVTEVADSVAPRSTPWRTLVVQNVSEVCARVFDAGQASLRPDAPRLYEAWLQTARHDHGPSLRAGLRGFRTRARALPSDPMDLVAHAATRLGVPSVELGAYFTSLLADVGGWAAWCTGQRWEAEQAGKDNDSVVDLLAIRLAWECILLDEGGAQVEERWALAMRSWPLRDAASRTGEEEDQVLQRAFELAVHRPLLSGLAATPRLKTQSAPPHVQAVFCIDVRSEVFRRALEGVAPDVQTRGFAGFFGLPAVYVPTAGAPVPHLPGPLAPRFRVVDQGLRVDSAPRRDRRLSLAAAWKRLRHGPLSGFAFVEALGPLAGPKLLTDALGLSRPVPRPDEAGLTAAERRATRPRLVADIDGAPLTVAARAAVAASALRGMGLTQDLAPIVLLCGHGSSCTNNPHAAALDCGACRGQSGEVSARAAAALLNDVAVRDHLRADGLDIPDRTRFLAALHDTTTDEVTLFETQDVPPTHQGLLDTLRRALEQAGHHARAERAAYLGLRHDDDQTLRHAVHQRARDWAETRPEWGLARNASFVVAPRAHVRHLDLGGRAFLHDYDAARDPDGAVLELLLTAPMVVSHWINLQYYASTVDPARWGGGDKVLHDVVGGGLGVFEGNGGDLRVGLPWQCVHDGTRFVHDPVRLAVVVEASPDAIDRVITRHRRVRDLVEHGWLHLHQWDGPGGTVRRRRRDGWRAAV